MDTKEVIARFEAERQALALMDHPNIAKVLDAGATESGRPYFVMELVHGVPITEFCDRNGNFPFAERLQLFVDVCQAVQHAHQKGIIHRDLKPSNVLVTMSDGQADPQGDRFRRRQGAEPATDRENGLHAFGQMVGTPLYMSPEQAEMAMSDVDTRERRLFAGSAAVRTADWNDAVRQKDAAESGLRRDFAASSAKTNRRGQAKKSAHCGRSY